MDGAEQFAVDLKRFAETIKVNYQLVVKKVTVDLLAEIIKRTPVDTGHLRNNWLVAEGYVPTGIRPGVNKRPVVSQLVKGINFDGTRVIWIVNNLPYAATIEYGRYPKTPKKGSRVKGKRGKAGQWVVKSAGGYSKQAPMGMVRVSLSVIEARLNGIVRDIANRKGGRA